MNLPFWKMSGRISFLTMLLACTVILSGCVSIDGKRVIDDGKGNVRTVDVGGMPVVVQRVTRVAFIVTKKHYQLVDPGGNILVDPITKKEISVVDVSLSGTPIQIGTNDVYTVDMKRPASGTIDYSIELDNFYPTKIGAELDDKTLSELRQAAADIVTALNPTKEDSGNKGTEGSDDNTGEGDLGAVEDDSPPYTRVFKAVSQELLIIKLDDGTITTKPI